MDFTASPHSCAFNKQLTARLAGDNNANHALEGFPCSSLHIKLLFKDIPIYSHCSHHSVSASRAEKQKLKSKYYTDSLQV